MTSLVLQDKDGINFMTPLVDHISRPHPKQLTSTTIYSEIQLHPEKQSNKVYWMIRYQNKKRQIKIKNKMGM